MEWTDWIPVAALSVVLVGGRNLIKAWIEKGLQHEFTKRLENLRTELRKTEEEFKSELRSKEDEISSIRNGVIELRSNRQIELEKRRLLAAENIWDAIVEFKSLIHIASMMSTIEFDAAAKAAKNDSRIAETFKPFYDSIKNKLPISIAEKEKPFVSPIAWALPDVIYT